MVASLTPKAKVLLLEQSTKLMFDDRAATTAVAAVKEILKWCENEDIVPGKWVVKGKKYRFNRQGIDKIQQAYLQIMGEDIFEDFSSDTHQTAAFKSADEKQGKIKPTEHLVLAALTNNRVLEGFQEQLYSCEQVNVELDIKRINYSSYDTLILIENRDSFNDWHKFQGMVENHLGNVLAIYRGDSHYSKAANLLIKNWGTSCHDKALVYFGDFDLSGLMLALAGNCTHLLLPKNTWLQQQLVTQHYPDEQLKYFYGVEQKCPSGWLSLFNLMSSTTAGLRQQRMYDTPLKLHSR
ncbi:hypothetical protein [Paraglaciecola sp. 2405UD69-4]|uniref:DUF7281 domain-containing protein n=1 Tax=Paraglaciecola sp. 2405UD69-4 TaxID=3391836 RepID=UPI0039C998B2